MAHSDTMPGQDEAGLVRDETGLATGGAGLAPAGERLRSWLDREAAGLGPARTMSLVAAIAEELKVAHADGIIHRDLRPEHVLIRPDGTVTLLEIGVASGWWSGADADPNRAPYLAPEQVTGAPVTAATDIYALGVIAYTCLAGQSPFAAQTPSATGWMHVRNPVPPLPPDLDPAVRDVVARALAKSPADRWPSAAALAAAATAARPTAATPAAMPTAATPAALPAPPSTVDILEPTIVDRRDPGPPTDFSLWVAPRRRRRLPYVLAGLAVVLVLAAAVVAVPLLTGDRGTPANGALGSSGARGTEAGGVGTLDNRPGQPTSAAPAPAQAPTEGNGPGANPGPNQGSGQGTNQGSNPAPPPAQPGTTAAQPPPPPPQRAPGAVEYLAPPNVLNAQYQDGSCVYGVFYGNYGGAAFAKVRFYNGACGNTVVYVASADGTGIHFLAVRGQEATAGSDACGSFYEIQATGGNPAYGIGLTVRFGETGHYLAFYYDQGATLGKVRNCG